jgi:hypothetical protein
MNRRTALKTVAFVIGLYFVLEFLLPDKIGGDFDSFEVGSPAPVARDGRILVFYTGHYKKGIGGVGRMIPDPHAVSGLVRNPDSPVMHRTLFVPYDRRGMEQLDAVTVGDTILLTYIGYNNDNQPTLCYASSSDGGESFRKLGPVLFTTNGPPASSIFQRNGRLPGRLMLYALDYRDASFEVDVILNVPDIGFTLWHAAGKTLTNMLLESAPRINVGTLCGIMEVFDAHGSGTNRILYFANGKDIVTFQPGIDSEAHRYPYSTNTGEIVSLRVGPDSKTLYVDTSLQVTPDKPEESLRKTALCTAVFPPGPDTPVMPQPFKSVGTFGTPTYLSRATNWAGRAMQIVGAMGVFIALINLMIFHGKKLARREKGGYNSLIFIGGLLYMAVFAAFTQVEEPLNFFKVGVDFGYNSIMVPMGAAVFSMITFYLISAAYRSFRIRSLEAALLMIAAVIVMMGQMPVGEWATMYLPERLAFLKLPWLSQKILTVINAAAYRGVWIGMLVGMFAISLRIWLGIDNSVYAGVEKND